MKLARFINPIVLADATSGVLDGWRNIPIVFTNCQLVRPVRQQAQCALPDLTAAVGAVTVSIELRFVEPHPVNGVRPQCTLFLPGKATVPCTRQVSDGIWRR